MARIPRVDSKDPSEVLDYQVDMTDELDGRGSGGADDTIESVIWTVPSGLTKIGQDHTGSKATVLIAGGELGREYRITAAITTLGSRTYYRSFRFRMETR